jgi:hypothetical protein
MQSSDRCITDPDDLIVLALGPTTSFFLLLLEMSFLADMPPELGVH